MRAFRVLDICCCAGGATKGYQRAGAHVTGVDIVARPRYIGDEFVQADALTLMEEWGGQRGDSALRLDSHVVAMPERVHVGARHTCGSGSGE